jgi:tRNA(Ile)-lysidine synthase
MSLLQQFKNYINTYHLLNSTQHALLAVSGGVDSIVLCELCQQAGISFSIAHCNFTLRGTESTRDEEFVKTLAEKYKVPFYLQQFDTHQYMVNNKLSVQVAARELRYNWFNKILQGEVLPILLPFQKTIPVLLVTAHHLNDNIETAFINFCKGTGITGMRGILPKTNNIVRPLLFATKNQLLQFAIANNLHWVEDSSNETDKYTRNFFRHKILPQVQEVFPEAEKNMAATIGRLCEAEMLYQLALQQHIKKLVTLQGNEIHLPVKRLQQLPFAKTLLHEILKPFNFSSLQINEVYNLLIADTGKYVASATHRVIKNRQWLIATPLQTSIANHVLIQTANTITQLPTGLIKMEFKTKDETILNDDASVAMLKAAAVQFPLIARRWKQGDYFYPLGMQKKKKLSRFFIDKKLSLLEKEKVWVLESNKKIIWVIGLRIDDRFKITPQTKQVLQVIFNKI